jgi:hypothetical protein
MAGRRSAQVIDGKQSEPRALKQADHQQAEQREDDEYLKQGEAVGSGADQAGCSSSMKRP